MADGGAGSGLPDTVGPGLSPGSLVAVLVVDGCVADYVPLTHDTTEVGDVAVRHAGASMEAVGVGRVAVVGIYDGDTGHLVAALAAMPVEGGGE